MGTVVAAYSIADAFSLTSSITVLATFVSREVAWGCPPLSPGDGSYAYDMPRWVLMGPTLVGLGILVSIANALTRRRPSWWWWI